MGDDVVKTVREILDEMPRKPNSYEIGMAIEGAILAERKRCAEVARHLNGWGADCGKGGHAEHIAKIIESGQ